MAQDPGIQRKLTTILAADAANFSGRMQSDEVGTVQALRRSKEIFESGISMRGGRIANTAGDGIIAEFPSVVEAVAAAVAIQRNLVAGKDLLPFRLGLHLGDVIVDGADLLGDGVNLAARLQDMATQGGILATQQVVDHAWGRLDAEFRPLGMVHPKGFAKALPVYAIVADGVSAPAAIEDLLPRIDPPEPSPAQVDSINKVTRYKRLRLRNGVIIAGLATLDLVTLNGFGWCLWPIAAFAGMERIGWLRLSPEQRDKVRLRRSS